MQIKTNFQQKIQGHKWAVFRLEKLLCMLYQYNIFEYEISLSCGKFRNHHREPLFGHGNTFDRGRPVALPTGRWADHGRVWECHGVRRRWSCSDCCSSATAGQSGRRSGAPAPSCRASPCTGTAGTSRWCRAGGRRRRRRWRWPQEEWCTAARLLRHREWRL